MGEFCCKLYYLMHCVNSLRNTLNCGIIKTVNFQLVINISILMIRFSIQSGLTGKLCVMHTVYNIIESSVSHKLSATMFRDLKLHRFQNEPYSEQKSIIIYNWVQVFHIYVGIWLST